MTKHLPTWQFIINPTAGGNRPRKNIKYLTKALNQSPLNYKITTSEYSGHSIEIATLAIQNGIQHIAVVGGDGSLNEVIQAIMQSPNPNKITLTTLPWGTGNDWARTCNIPKRPKAFIQFLMTADSRLQDVGKVIYCQNKIVKQHYFLNSVGCGFDSYLLEKMGSAGGSRWVYYSYLLKCLKHYSAAPMKIACNNLDALDNKKSLMTMACITPFGGGGMRFAPQAEVDDGLFDFIDINDMPLIQRALSLPYLSNGKIAQHPQVTSLQTDCFSLDTQHAPDNITFQCDGELIGTLPLTATIQKQAVRVLHQH